MITLFGLIFLIVLVNGVLTGFIDKMITALPVELHLPGYRYCGPGTKLQGRIQRGDRGINGLDEACKEHDLAYTNESGNDPRRRADDTLGTKALGRLFSASSSFLERFAALHVACTMDTMSGYRYHKPDEIKPVQKLYRS